jgi:hypothetical protein
MSNPIDKDDYNKQLAEMKKAGNALGRQVLRLLLTGVKDDELIKAYYDWRDVSIGPPNFGKTAKKSHWSKVNL